MHGCAITSRGTHRYPLGLILFLYSKLAQFSVRLNRYLGYHLYVAVNDVLALRHCFRDFIKELLGY